MGGEASLQGRILLYCHLPALLSNLQDVGQSGIGKCPSRGIGDSTRHIRDAVEGGVVNSEGGILVGSGVGVLKAATLVDGNVNEHSALLHLCHHVVGHQLRSGSTRDEDGANNQVGSLESLGDLSLVGHDGVDTALVNVVESLQSSNVDVEDGDVSTHTNGHSDGIGASGTGTEYDHVGGTDTAHAAEQLAAAAVLLHQMLGAHLDREAASNFGHRGKQRELAIRSLDNFVSDGGGACLEQGIAAIGAGGEVQVGEQHLVIAHAVEFLGDGLLYLDNEIALLPYFVGGLEHGGASLDVLFIGEVGSDTGGLFHENFVAAVHELGDAGGGDGYAEFVVLNFLGNANAHCYS